ncbi:MAG: hypothetical protein AAF639_44905 [Chloroflexota bacterium]
MIGFTGSRNLDDRHQALVSGLVQSLADAGRVELCVGCANGLDAMVRAAAPYATVFDVKSGRWGQGRNAYAARSADMVKAIAQGDRPGLVGVASSPCPDRIVPARRWVSGQPPSGTWSTIAFAIGLDIKTTIFIVDDGQLPRWAAGAWVPAGRGLWADGALWKAEEKQLFLF